MRRIALLMTFMVGAVAGAPGAGAQDYETLAEPEQMAMADTLQYALENNPTDQASDWVNPDSGRGGAVTPVRTCSDAQGRPCREFISTIIIGGREEQGYGTACRQPDGSWQIVANASQPAESPAPTTVNVYPVAERYYYYPGYYPVGYYYYPSGFYGPYGIYLSFSYVYRSGHRHYGNWYVDGRTFRHRHPLPVRQRVYIGPRHPARYDWYHNQRIYRDYRGRHDIGDRRWTSPNHRDRGRPERHDFQDRRRTAPDRGRGERRNRQR
jgi:surface antigen